jgi:hypothetical protein
LLTLVIMTVFIIQVCERLFRRREIEVCQHREMESAERETKPKVLSEPGNLQQPPEPKHGFRAHYRIFHDHSLPNPLLPCGHEFAISLS